MATRKTTFRPDRQTYIRSQTWLAALAMAGAMAVLWLMGNPHVWTGAIAGLAAIGLRGWYVASEELAAEWTLAGESLTGPAGREISLTQIETVRTMMSFVQVITRSGDKHLIKYLPNPEAVAAEIEAAVARGRA